MSRAIEVRDATAKPVVLAVKPVSGDGFFCRLRTCRQRGELLVGLLVRGEVVVMRMCAGCTRELQGALEEARPRASREPKRPPWTPRLGDVVVQRGRPSKPAVHGTVIGFRPLASGEPGVALRFDPGAREVPGNTCAGSFGGGRSKHGRVVPAARFGGYLGYRRVCTVGGPGPKNDVRGLGACSILGA